nr:MAG TPA: hypothetical protein [Caudoviricetes sp.]
MTANQFLKIGSWVRIPPLSQKNKNHHEKFKIWDYFKPPNFHYFLIHNSIC